MVMGVDRTCSEMENWRWRRRRTPGLTHTHTRAHTQEAADGSRPSHVQDVKYTEREMSASKKTVTMAPTSRYMTSRRLYTARKPLITAEPQISILKNPLTHDSETVHTREMERPAFKHPDTYTTDSISIPRVRTSSPSASREDFYTSLSLSDLRLDSGFSPVPSASKKDRRSLSSPPLDDFSFTVPLSPTKWTSSHSYTSQTRPSRKTKTRQDKESLLKTSSSLGYSSGLKPMSTYQANYWACAIPRSLPPSPDRSSPSWDPDKEYQALLDYTYPLRPNMGPTWSSSESRPLIRTDPLLQDSGIELDRFSSLSCLNQKRPGGGASSQRSGLGSELLGLNLRDLSHSKSSDGRLSSSLYSSLDHVGLSVDSLDCESKQIPEIYKKSSIFSTSRSAPTVIRSTCVLPRLASLDDLDEEFLRLPEQLQELQDLSLQLRDITAQMNQPVITSWDSVEKESVSGVFSAAQMEKQTVQVSDDNDDDDDDVNINSRSLSKAPDKRQTLSEQLDRLGARVQMISSEVNKGSLTEVEAIMDQLSGAESQRRTRAKQSEGEVKESLLQHIQAFCSNLEELIQWLYKVVEKMELLSPPSVDIKSVKASLADYKSFQRELQAHQPLTASVLQTGEMLLCCMNSASPFLKETLMLIERQSRVLETHSDHLFSSILSAMDCLTEPSSQSDSERTS